HWATMKSKPRVNSWVGNTLRLKSLRTFMLRGMQNKQAQAKKPLGMRNSPLTRKLTQQKPLNTNAA
ncbi:transketolase, thiamine diphosphate binding domain protein, partial [Vibrio cholerae HC-41B1]